MKKIFETSAQILIVFILLFFCYLFFEPYFSPWFRAKRIEYLLGKADEVRKKQIMLHILPSNLKKPIFLICDRNSNDILENSGDTTLVYYDGSCIKKSSLFWDFYAMYVEGIPFQRNIVPQKYCFANYRNKVKDIFKNVSKNESILEDMPCMCDDNYKRRMIIITICDSLTSQILVKRDSFVNDYCLKTKK